MTRAIILELNEIQKLQKTTEELLVIAKELREYRQPPTESPMNAKETSKYLKCSLTTVYTKWTHLRHMVDGTPYWFKSEIEAYIKEK